jgi:tripartite-type tricarboxylate transporter receptor subunit TctC
MGRPYVAPPGTPDNLMNILREAFRKVSEDPEFVGEAQRIKRNVIYTSHKDALEIANLVLTQPPDIVQEISRYNKL